jgi:peptide-methionine (R)-S-oxide reductase
MMMQVSRRGALGLAGVASAGALAWASLGRAAPAQHYEVTLSDAEWKKRLSPEAYAVLRQESTERPYSSPLNNEHRAGVFGCAGCKLPLFSSKTKFDSGTGWPSFWAPLPNAVSTKRDTLIGEERTEVHCRRCGGHLGHVFDDGPQPTGKRYCMNGVAMIFAPGRA